jgi:hypothetical protein
MKKTTGKTAKMRSESVFSRGRRGKKIGRRPKVGEITSDPILVKPGCFAPLTEKELGE